MPFLKFLYMISEIIFPLQLHLLFFQSAINKFFLDIIKGFIIFVSMWIDCKQILTKFIKKKACNKSRYLLFYRSDKPCDKFERISFYNFIQFCFCVLLLTIYLKKKWKNAILNCIIKPRLWQKCFLFMSFSRLWW